ncbi:hypothetical protein FH972_015083 [Carpinus fangiana]|uniref:Uncharacterized protein n=1 Tax=Carpinus fangiana TaxID=176857 RepID=A0A5N6RF99_9ROSI|nr:hypothetical protein FH972_015083 [Carpinus fangiana]
MKSAAALGEVAELRGRVEDCNRCVELDLLQYSWRRAKLKEGRLMARWQSSVSVARTVDGTTTGMGGENESSHLGCWGCRSTGLRFLSEDGFDFESARPSRRFPVQPSTGVNARPWMLGETLPAIGQGWSEERT